MVFLYEDLGQEWSMLPVKLKLAGVFCRLLRFVLCNVTFIDMNVGVTEQPQATT